jgi:photoactive yellow protein
MSASAGHGRPGSTPDPAFGDPGLLPALEASAVGSFDGLGFGVITMDRSGTVTDYNAYEARRAGLEPDRVIGRDFFVDVGPCTNNYLIAERFHDSARRAVELDEELDFVFTFRMRPTPVRLRLLAAVDSPRQYLLVRPR